MWDELGAKASSAADLPADAPSSVHQSVSDMLRPLWVYFVHVTIGTALFILISSAAVGLHFWVQWLANLGVTGFLVHGCEWAAYAVFLADLFAYGVYIVRTTRRLVEAVW